MLRKLLFVGSLFVLLLTTTGGVVGQRLASPATQGEGPVTVQAGLGTGFTYQGELKMAGVPVNDSCDLQFGLWDAATGGAQQGMTQPVANVSVSGGLFTVLLNDSAQFGPNALNGQRRYLEIQVRCPAGSGGYTTLVPRQELTAAPYAMHALHASGLSTVDESLQAVTVLADRSWLPNPVFHNTTYATRISFEYPQSVDSSSVERRDIRVSRRLLGWCAYATWILSSLLTYSQPMNRA